MSNEVPLILHVDDNEAHRYTMSKLLRMAGYEVDEAENGHDALELAKKKPNLIILDVNLPDMNGFLVCRHLKSDPSTSSIPVLHVSAARILANDKTQGLMEGADAYLTEPVDSGEFLATVNALLRIRVSENRARQLARDWEATFNAINDGLVITDTDGRIQRANRAVASMLNKAATEFIGKTVPQVLVDAFAVPSEELAKLDLTGESPEAREIELGGSWYRVATNVSRDEEDRIKGRVHSFQDFTRLKLAEDERNRYINELARSNDELNQFCNVASHDLKEPLRMVATHVQMIKRRYLDKLDDAGLRHIGFAVEGATRMNSLIEDLLHYSKVGSGVISPAPTDLNGLLSTVKQHLEPTLRETRGELYAETLPILNVDPIQFLQLLQNLVANGLKFHGQKLPRVGISAKKLDHEWRFLVEDNGIGISETNLKKIFGLFFRVHSRQEYPGTGIGLAICKKIVERHGGRLWVESQVGEGSKFYFTVPKGDAA